MLKISGCPSAANGMASWSLVGELALFSMFHYLSQQRSCKLIYLAFFFIFLSTPTIDYFTITSVFILVSKLNNLVQILG